MIFEGLIYIGNILLSAPFMVLVPSIARIWPDLVSIFERLDQRQLSMTYNTL